MEEGCIGFPRSMQAIPELIQRIGMEAELEGHNGCVNCLEWNETGSLLASGSDDVQVKVWDPFRHRSVGSIMTGHTGNIFTVKFMPKSSDSLLVSGAADCKIRVHELNAQETTHVFSCHAGRVKRIATAANVPFMFWSAAEDGTVMQFDLRDPDSASSINPRNVLINLKSHMGSYAEAKCLAINPLWPEQLAVGANDPYVRLYDRRMLSCRGIKFPSEPSVRSLFDQPSAETDSNPSEDSTSMPTGCVRYFVAGHLPQKQQEYKKKYRTLASTYLTFSPDGREMLVNLGGEQIYLFDVNKRRKPQKFSVTHTAHSNGLVKGAQRVQSKAHCSHLNGTTTNGVTNGISKHLDAASSKMSTALDSEEYTACSKSRKRALGRILPPAVDAIKQQANAVFEKQQYTQAILLYNEALALAPESPILHSNRAAAYMKRNWDGDLYAALRDCHCAIQLDNEHLKAHFRLAKCLYELSWAQEALDCLQVFKSKFPDYAGSNACESLDRDIRAAIFSTIESDSEAEKSAAKKKKDSASDEERSWRSQANDYELRFCGHCNTTTDIKEANFFGSNGQYIVAGSDDGSFFIWEKRTTNIVRVLRGDDSIVNCLQPHPTQCLMATSGIDPVVRLWSPRPEDGKKDEREVDNSDDAASANQRRMNADPLEVMLMNMGYRVTGVLDGDEEDERESGETAVPCRPS